MILFADHVPFRFRPRVACQAVAAELVDHLGRAAHADLVHAGLHVEFEEFPVIGGGIVARRMLHHDFSRYELHDRARRIRFGATRVCGCERRVHVAQEVAYKEAAHGLQVANAAKTGVADRQGFWSGSQRCRRNGRLFPGLLRSGAGAGDKRRGSRQGSDPSNNAHLVSPLRLAHVYACVAALANPPGRIIAS
jgi:hypothetical protein